MEPHSANYRAAVVGGTGYTGLEILKILARHPRIDVTRITSRSEAGQPLHAVHPQLRGRYNLSFTVADPCDISENADVVFCCLPHAASAPFISKLDPSLKIVDLSADYRLSEASRYESLYGVTHPQPQRLGQIPYGIPELFRSQIETANLVANPGCFPTSGILPLAPLLVDGLISELGIIVDSKTGVSGAGRTAKLKFHFPEANENLFPYGIATHRHGPEMNDVLDRFVSKTRSGLKTEPIVFTPHLVPMNRGIVSTIYVDRLEGATVSKMVESLRAAYNQEPLIRILNDGDSSPPSPPQASSVAHTNFCDIAVYDAGSKTIIVSAIDNLIKGASGAAVQNMNIMLGLDPMLGS